MLKIFSFLLMVFGFSYQITAQCGVYFKESNRQVLSNPIVNGYFEDIDNDGLEDLFGYSRVTMGFSDFQIHYYKRLSQNSFETTAKSTLIEDVGFAFGVFGDVNGDGKKDLIGTRWNSSSQVLLTYLNDGTGKFDTTTTPVNFGSDGYVWAAGDLNGDGRADILTAPYTLSGGTLYYRLTKPDLTFDAPVAIANYTRGPIYADYMDLFAAPIILEDLNNDGAKDVAFVEGVDDIGTLRVFTNNGSLTFTETLTTEFAMPTVKLKAFDLNNDGKKDFVSNSRGFFGQVKLLANNGDNTFTSSTLNLPFESGNRYDLPLAKDFLVADFDNDGDLDLLHQASKKYFVSRNQGNATFVTETFNGLLNVNALANLDGDGKADTVTLARPLIDAAYRLSDGNNSFYFYNQKAVVFRKNVCDPVGQTKMVDFNGDVYFDRAFWNPETGVWRYYHDNDPNPPNPPQTTFQWGLTNDVPVPNDYDGDGKTDYAVFRPTDGTWWVFRSSNGTSYALGFGTSEDRPVTADYDGDGKADIAVFRPSTGDWHFWMSQTNSYAAAHFGATGDKPVPADYDGDGKADMAVFRPSSSVWYRFYSSDYSVSVIQYGVGTDRPVPGDYDADGKANVAVYRNGVWYVLREDFSTSILNFGIANDIPVVLDSMNNPLLGAYRASSRTFYLATPGIPFGLTMSTGNSTNEIFVSSILPPE